jgi:hypothetical protein
MFCSLAKGLATSLINDRQAASLSSLSSPHITILITSSGNGRCSAFASSAARASSKLAAVPLLASPGLLPG